MQSDARLYNDLYNVKKKTRNNFKAMILKTSWLFLFLMGLISDGIFL